MISRFASERTRLVVIGLFVVLLFGPGFVMSLVDRATNPHPPDVQTLLAVLAVLFGAGLLWSVWLVLPPVVVVGTSLTERTAFGRKRVELSRVARLERRRGRAHRTSFDFLSLHDATGATLVTIDLLRLHDPEGLVAVVAKVTGRGVSP